MGQGAEKGGGVPELGEGCTRGSFTSWGMSEVSLCVVFKSSSLTDLFLIKQCLVT